MCFALAALAGACGASPAGPSAEAGPQAKVAALSKSPDQDREACAGGDGAACERAALPYREGRSGGRELLRADVELFRRACEAKETAGACVALAWTLPVSDAPRAIALFLRGCAGGSALGCASLAEAYEIGAGIPKDDAHALRIYQGACSMGLAEACARAAEMLDRGRGAPSDPAAAVAAYAKACDGGVADACAAVAIAMALGYGAAKDEARGALFFQKGCDAGSQKACSGLGIAHAYGRGVPKDEARAAELLRRPCVSGDALSCRELAQVLTSPSSPAKDDREGLALYLRACDKSDAAACTAAGGLLAAGRGAAADPARAAALWTKACDAGNTSGCTWLGLAYFSGRGVSKDARKAAALLDKACTNGQASACNVLGIAHAFGDGVPRDNARAEVLFRAACEQGSATGCSRLGLCYQMKKPGGGASYDFGIAQAAADCKRTALACEWLGGVPREQAETGFKLLVGACDAEVPAACSSLARAVAAGRVPRAAAATLMTEIRARCTQGKALWCRRLAFWHEEGLSVPRSEAIARDFYKRACDGGDARACGDFGRMLATGQGGKKNIGEAVGVLKRACDGGGGEGTVACGHLGMIYLNDSKLADHAAGSQLLERACSQGDGLACDRLGGFYTVGAKGFIKDERRAADLLERACALGGFACDEARKLRERFGMDDLR